MVARIATREFRGRLIELLRTLIVCSMVSLSALVWTIPAACAPRVFEPEQAVFGTWRVTGSICPTDCAMTRAEADAWRGRTATYQRSLARFADHSCASPHYHAAYWPADGRYGGARLWQFGVTGDSALVIEVQCRAQRQAGSDPRWQVPGAFLIARDRDHMLMVWEGVYFELTRQ